MREKIATAFQAVGVAGVAVAGFTVAPGLGFLTLGAGFLLFGLALER